MTLRSDLSTAPYFDEYDSEKNYQRILFKPSTPVQVRELNELQSMLQHQVETFGDHILQNGTILNGCQTAFDTAIPFVKLKDVTADGAGVVLNDYVGLFARNSANLVSKVIDTIDGFEKQDPDLKTLYLDYINSGNSSEDLEYATGETLTIYSNDQRLFNIAVDSASQGFSNADSVVVVSAIEVQNTTGGTDFANGSFEVGEVITQDTTEARAEIIAIDNQVANTNAVILSVKPLVTDLQNRDFNKWRFEEGYNFIGGTTGNEATLTGIVGEGATASHTTTTAGAIRSVSLIEPGRGYYYLPFVTIASSQATAGQYNDLSLRPENYRARVIVATDMENPVTGTGYGMSISDGTIYHKGHFISVNNQSIIVEKYANTPSDVSVGFNTDEEFIDATIDTSLVDNASGTLNESAPGADRLMLTPTLSVRDTFESRDDDNFLPIVSFNSGRVYTRSTETQYSRLGDELAKRTYEESGNYVLDSFNVTTKSPLTVAESASNFMYVIDPGLAYIGGYRVRTESNYIRSINKGTDSIVETDEAQDLIYGNYVRCNELAGSFPFTRGAMVSLYSREGNAITENLGFIPKMDQVYKTDTFSNTVTVDTTGQFPLIENESEWEWPYVDGALTTTEKQDITLVPSSDIVFANNYTGTVDETSIKHMSTAVVDSDYTLMQGLTFSPDGTKFFATGTESPAVATTVGNVAVLRQYTVPIPWDLTSVDFTTSAGSIDLETDNVTNPTAMVFSSDGTKIFVHSHNTRYLVRYDLSTAWSLTGATKAQAKYMGHIFRSNLPSMDISDDGTKLIFLASDTRELDTNIHQCTLSTPYDLTTLQIDAVIPTRDYNIDTMFTNIKFSDNGTIAWAGGPAPFGASVSGTPLLNQSRNRGSLLIKFNLTTPWDMTTATPIGYKNLIDETRWIIGMFFGDNDNRLYFGEAYTGEYDEYSIPSDIRLSDSYWANDYGVLSGFGTLFTSELATLSKLVVEDGANNDIVTVERIENDGKLYYTPSTACIDFTDATIKGILPQGVPFDLSTFDASVSNNELLVDLGHTLEANVDINATYTLRAEDPDDFIGSARIRSVVYENGIVGTPDCTYRLYLFDIKMQPGKNFEDVRSLYVKDIAIADTIQEVVPGARQKEITVLKDKNRKGLLVQTNKPAKSINNITYHYRTQKNNVAANTAGVITVPVESGAEWPYVGVLTPAEKRDIIITPEQTIRQSADYPGTVTKEGIKLVHQVHPSDAQRFMHAIVFDPTGTKMFVVGSQPPLDNPSLKGWSTSRVPGVAMYTLSVPWELSSATFNTFEFFNTREYGIVNPTSLDIVNDGKTLIIGTAQNTGSGLHQFTLNTPWDINTARFEKVRYTWDLFDGWVGDLNVIENGTKAVVISGAGGQTNWQKIYQCTMTRPYDIDSLVVDDIINPYIKFDTLRSEFRRIDFTDDGMMAFIGGAGPAGQSMPGFPELNKRVLQYSELYQFRLTKPYDMGTASLVGVYDLGETIWLLDITFSNDYKYMYVAEARDNEYLQFYIPEIVRTKGLFGLENAVLIGSNTEFTTTVTEGDSIELVDGSNTDIVIVDRIESDDVLYFSPKSAAEGFTDATYARVIPANVPLNLSRNDYNAEVVGTNLVVDLGFGTSAQANVSITYNQQLTNTTPIAKTVNRKQYVKLQANTHSQGTSGPWCLGLSDVFRLRAVYAGETTSAANVTDEFFVEHQQKEAFYDQSYLYLKPTSSYSIDPNGTLLVEVDVFTTSSQGVRSITSYNVDDTKTLGELDVAGNSLHTLELPELNSTSGKYYDLRETLDFRPVSVNTATLTSTPATATINPLPVNDENRFQDVNLMFPKPMGDVSYDIEYYTAREDSILLNSTAEFTFSIGKEPTTLDKDTLYLAHVKVPPYPSLPNHLSKGMNDIIDTRVSRDPVNHKRRTKHTIIPTISKKQISGYTMSEIRQLERRISVLEYYATLTETEDEVKNLNIPSSVDSTIERFKYGFFVDNFENYERTNQSHPEQNSMIFDYVLRPKAEQYNVGFRTTQETRNTYQTSNILRPKYTTNELISQRIATDGEYSRELVSERNLVTRTRKTTRFISNTDKNRFSPSWENENAVADGIYDEVIYPLQGITTRGFKIDFNLYGAADKFEFFGSTSRNGPWESFGGHEKYTVSNLSTWERQSIANRYYRLNMEKGGLDNGALFWGTPDITNNLGIRPDFYIADWATVTAGGEPNFLSGVGKFTIPLINNKSSFNGIWRGWNYLKVRVYKGSPMYSYLATYYRTYQTWATNNRWKIITTPPKAIITTGTSVVEPMNLSQFSKQTSVSELNWSVNRTSNKLTEAIERERT